MPFTSKQRANLRSLASTLRPIAQVGKEGISDNLIQGISEALEAHELIKVTLLPSAGEDAAAIAASLSAKLGAETVAVIGRKAIFYRRSSRKDVEHIEY